MARKLSSALWLPTKVSPSEDHIRCFLSPASSVYKGKLKKIVNGISFGKDDYKKNDIKCNMHFFMLSFMSRSQPAIVG